jgi:hypothetical protein
MSATSEHDATGVKRDALGRIVAGSKLNPSGRPALLREVRDLARVHTAEAIETLAAIMRDSEKDLARVAAANALLDRGWGKPGNAGPDDAEKEISGAAETLTAEQVQALARARLAQEH